MDHWQKCHLTKNIHLLVENTTCDGDLLSWLESMEELSKADLESIRCKDNRMDKSYLLFQLLETRTNGFWSLAKALAECKQTGSFDILMRGFLLQLISHFAPPDPSPDVLIATEIISTIQKHVTPDSYIKFCQEMGSCVFQNFQLTKHMIPQPTVNYIPRTLSKRTVIDKKLFTVACPDIFVFKNIGYYEIRQFVPNSQRIAASSRQVENGIDCRFIRLDEDVDWDKIRNNAKAPAHLIQFENCNQTFILEDSTCNSRILHYHLVCAEEWKVTHDDYMSDICINEKDFVRHVLSQSGAYYCFCDSPGMGKTLLLSSLAKQFEQVLPQKHVVAFVRLSSMINKARNISEHDTKTRRECQEMRQILLTHLSTSSMAQNILNELFCANILHLELFLDGLDEVDSSKLYLAKCLISKIVTFWPKTRIFVSCRLHLRHELESMLKVISYNILPFSQKDKITFLTSFWNQSQTGSKIVEEQLSEFAHYCLWEFRQNCSKEESDITGVPLQCRLLGEVYASNAIRFSYSKRDISVEESFTFESSLPQLYKMYTKLGFEKCANVLGSLHVSRVKNFHVCTALHAIFPMVSATVSRYYGVDITTPNPNVFTVGLLENRYAENKETTDFVHRMFAEFLTADFFVSLLSNENGQFTKKFRKKILSFMFQTVLQTTTAESSKGRLVYKNNWQTFSYAVVAYFINSALEDIPSLREGQPQLGLCELFLSKSFFDQDQFYEIVIACLYHNYGSIFTLMTSTLMSARPNKIKLKNTNMNPFTCMRGFKSGQVLSSPKTELVTAMLNIAVRNSSVSLVIKLFQFIFDYLKFNMKNSEQFFNFATLRNVFSRGDYEMMDVLTSQNILQLNNTMWINYCLENSNENSVEVVKCKLDICRLLLAKNSSIISSTSFKNLRNQHVHLNMLKWLVSQGVNPLDIYNGETILHWTARYSSKNHFHELCRYLIEDYNVITLFAENHPIWTDSLKNIFLIRTDTSPETIQMILKLFGRISQMNLNALLVLAFATRQSPTILQIFLNFNRNFDEQNVYPLRTEDENNIFDYLPSLHIDKGPLDEEGNTFLHLIIKHYEGAEYLKILKFLASKITPDFFTKGNANMELPIHLAIGHIYILEATLNLLLDCGLDFNLTDEFGRSLLICAISGSKKAPPNLLANLIDKVDVYIKDKYGQTFAHLLPYHYSPMEYHEIVKIIIDKGHKPIFAMWNKYMLTPLHYAVEQQELLPETIKLLFTKTMVNEVEKFGSSLLHCAVKGIRSTRLLMHLMDCGADWTARDEENRNLALVCASLGNIEHLKYFLELGCDITEVDYRGNNILQCALQCSRFGDLMDIIKFLLSKGLDKLNENESGETAYMMALKRKINL